MIALLSTESEKVPVDQVPYLQTPFLITDVTHGNYSQTESGVKIHLKYLRPWGDPATTAFLQKHNIHVASDTIFIGQEILDVHVPDAALTPLIRLLERGMQEPPLTIPTQITPIYFYLAPEQVDFGRTTSTARTSPETLANIPNLQNFNYTWTEQYLRLNMVQFTTAELRIRLKFIIVGEIRREESLIQDYGNLFQAHYPTEPITIPRLKTVLGARDLGNGWVSLEKDPEYFQYAPLTIILFKEYAPQLIQRLGNKPSTPLNINFDNLF